MVCGYKRHSSVFCRWWDGKTQKTDQKILANTVHCRVSVVYLPDRWELCFASCPSIIREYHLLYNQAKKRSKLKCFLLNTYFFHTTIKSTNQVKNIVSWGTIYITIWFFTLRGKKNTTIPSFRHLSVVLSLKIMPWNFYLFLYLKKQSIDICV
jgi:hypothetical protein